MCETVDKVVTDVTASEAPATERQGTIPKRKYHTRLNAGQVDSIIREMVIPTYKRNLAAFSLNDKKEISHLIPISKDVSVEYEDHTLRLNGNTIYNTKGLEAYLRADISDIDIRLLRVIYGSIVQKMRPLLDNRTWEVDMIDTFGLRVFLPDLIEAMGYTDRRKINQVYKQLESYRHIIGLYAPRRGHQTLQPALLLQDRDERTNVVTLVSPYLNRIALEAYLYSFPPNTKRKLLMTDLGVPIRKPTDSYLIRATIAAEKNKRAAEIVCILVTLIEQAGEKNPHIKASTIVERHPELKAVLNSAKTNNQRNVVLYRAFSAAWSMLLKSEHTKISAVYKSFCVESYHNDGSGGRTISYASRVGNAVRSDIDEKLGNTGEYLENDNAGPEPVDEYGEPESNEHDLSSASDSAIAKALSEGSSNDKPSLLRCTIPPSPTMTTLDTLVYLIRHGKKATEARGLGAKEKAKSGRSASH